MRLLILDDEQVIRDVLEKLLAAPGREVYAVASGAEACALASRQQLDVAVLDKNLVGESGLTVGRELRKLQPELELILLTGFASVDSAVEAMQLGAFDYLQKPIEDYDALERRVQQAHERSALRRGQQLLLRQLTESELRFRRLAESSPDALILHNPETGRILDVNGAAQALYGYAPAEFLRLSVRDLQAGPDLHRRKDGTSFPVEVRATQLSLEGSAAAALAVRDVTERRRAEREKDELETRLRIAQKMEAVGRLAGGVAHDFNNLLAVILAHTDFLSDMVSGDARTEADAIRRTAERGAALTRQLLLFSRHKPIELAQVDVNAVVAEVLRLTGRVLGAHVKLRHALAPAPWAVRADADQLAQVVLNLAVNARDALPLGGEIVVRTENCELSSPRAVRSGELAPGRWIVLSVHDDGVGMSDAVQARLFEPFFTTKEPGKGTGLGLATIYGIVRAFGGQTDVQSREAAGTTFSVWLPAIDGAAPEEPAALQARPRGRGETVLVVEDEEPLRAVVRRMLAQGGYTVLEARNGDEALQLAGTHRGGLDLLVTDMVMPGMNGRALAAELLRLRPGLRVLFMTGYTETAVGDLGASAALIEKPFVSAAFLTQVRRLLDGRAEKSS